MNLKLYSAYLLLSLLSDWALLALRAVLGVISVAHGCLKLKNLPRTADNFNSIGFRPGKLWGTLAALVEFFGGLLLILGYYAKPVAFALVVEFLVINIWKWSRREPLVGGYELDLLILAAALTVLFLGAGAFSLDHFYLLGGS